MYRHCIYCSGDLGTNEAIEAFPVGRALAFDGAKGRLWAICPHCARWNLSPLEERWEALEAAEKLFRDTRLRVQSENIGLARLRDGTKLVRVGAALRGELAAWRYGQALRRRRRGWMAGLALPGAMSVAWAGWVVAGPVLAGVTGLAGTWAAGFGVRWLIDQARLRRARAIERSSLARVDVPGRGPELLTRRDLHGAFLTPGADPGAVALHLWRPANPRFEAQWARVEGAEARATLSRLLVGVNSSGAAGEDVETVVRVLGAEESAGEYLRKVSERGFTFGQANRWAFDYAYWNERAEAEGVTPAGRLLWQAERQKRVYGEDASSRIHNLLLEVALHEESERRALEGELALLHSAWREAEEIASLADRLGAEHLALADGGRSNPEMKGEG